MLEILLIILWILAGFFLAGFMLALGMQVLLASTMLHGPVFVPSADDKLATMLKLAQLKKGQRIIDLGSGDGKVILEIARNGLAVEGVEINPILVYQTKQQAAELHLDHLVTVHRASFWKIDLSQYDVIFLYGTSYIMDKLAKKLQAEMKPSARLVSNYFQFANWQPVAEENDVRVYQK